MLDATIVAAAIADRAAYEIVAPHINSKDMTPAGGFWYGLIEEWYRRDRSAKSIDKALLAEQGAARAPIGKNREPVMGLLRDLPEAVSPANTATVALELKRHNVSMELASAIASRDAKKIPALHKQMGELLAATSLTAKRGKWEYALDGDALYEATGAGNRIPLAPALLNDRCAGGALPGHHIIVFGRPESGKSTFAINQAATWGVKHKQRVLYVGNEESVNVLKVRCQARTAGLTWDEAQADRERVLRLWAERAGDRIEFAKLTEGSVADLPEAIEKHEATIIVVDQIRGLQSDADGMTAKLEQNAIAIRNLLSRYNLIGLTITQANNRAQGYNQRPPVWLGMEDIDSSRTGLPGTGDLIIGIGFDDDMFARNQRALSICKNKLASGPQSREGINVEFDLAHGRVR